MADERRIIFSNFISPQIGVTIPATTQTLEEYSVGNASYVKWRIDTGVQKSIGGKGSIVNASTQWGDGWFSGHAPSNTWEEMDALWEADESTWGGELLVTSGGTHYFSDDGSACIFLFAKNTGDNDLKITVGHGFDIKLQPGGSVIFRPEARNCNQIYAKAIGSDTYIEYLIAK